jgi:16S rRNA (guanine(527)-N(7))-methyltransferase RsmG
MQTARISALLEPFLTHPLSEPQLNQISIYIDLLQRWNARINLTAIRTEEEIVTRHFGESLFLARHVFPRVERTLLPTKANTSEMPAPPISPTQCHPERSHVIREADAKAQSKDPYSTTKSGAKEDHHGSTAHRPPTADHRVLDIGSGAGFPALPLKIWAPQLHLNMIESNHKKSAFLKEVSRALTFTNINVITERAEDISARPDHHQHQAEVVTLRAVERFEAILPQAIDFLADHSTLALLIGASQIPKLSSHPTLNWQPPIPIPNSNTRVLLLGYTSNRSIK